jgi:hypothetical protein
MLRSLEYIHKETGSRLLLPLPIPHHEIKGIGQKPKKKKRRTALPLPLVDDVSVFDAPLRLAVLGLGGGILAKFLVERLPNVSVFFNFNFEFFLKIFNFLIKFYFNKYNYLQILFNKIKAEVVGVELDPDVVQIATDFFDLPVGNTRLRVEVMDAMEFLTRTAASETLGFSFIYNFKYFLCI